MSEIEAKIETKYLKLGGASGFLGKAKNPNAPATKCADGKGSFREYENGFIYSSADGEHEVRGAIFELWKEMNLESGALGYPTTDQRGVSDGIGRYNEFQNGVIYWSPSTGAHAVRDDILSKWRMFGGPRGVLGYPTSGQVSTIKDGKFNTFEKGAIFWRNDKAFAVHGEIHKKWLAKNGVSGELGFPISDELPSASSNSRFVRFEKGVLTRIVPSPTPPAAGSDTLPDVFEAHDRSLPDIKSDHGKHSGKGRRLLSLSLYGDPADPLYACLWAKDGGPEQRVFFGGSLDKLTDFLNDPKHKDFQPALIGATGPADSAVFALVMEKGNERAPVLRVKLVSGPIEGIYNPETFAYWCQWARGAQFILRSAAIYGSPKSPRYAGIWHLHRSEVPWNVAYHDAAKNIRTNFVAEGSPKRFDQDQMPEITQTQKFWASTAFAARSPHGHELRVFRADRVRTTVLRAHRSLPDYLSDLAELKGKRVPISLQAVRVDGESRFTVVLSDRVKPKRTLQVTGKERPSLIAFDEAMTDMTKSTGARASSLAIAKDGRLVYARAFTWDDPDAPPVQPTDVFRLASCSKPITAVGVYQLAEDKRLKANPPSGDVKKQLDNLFIEQIKLKPPDKTPLADNFDAITTSMILAHKGGFQKPIDGDEEILETINASLPSIPAGEGLPPVKVPPKELPLNMLQVASYMATIPLEAFPGTKEIYSNVGFLFLGFLIEQNLGKPYEQALQERIFQKIGVKRARLVESSPNLAKDEVIALDRQLRVGRSVMNKKRPIVPHDYGTTNRANRPGTGGWVMAPADYVRFLADLHLGKETLLKKTTVAKAVNIREKSGSHDGAVAYGEHLDNGITFAVCFAINFFGDFEDRIRDIINVLPASAWPATDDLFKDPSMKFGK